MSLRTWSMWLLIAMAMAAVPPMADSSVRPEAPRTGSSSSPGWIPGFGMPNGCNGFVHDFAYDSRGYVYVAGRFTTCGDVGANNVARFDLNSRTWSALEGADGGNGVSGHVNSLVIEGDDLYVGGNFDRANVGAPITAHSVARWDGSAWHALAATGGQGVEGIVYAMVWFDGNLYVGGSIWVANVGDPVPASYLARWDGNSWSDPGTSGGGPAGVVMAMIVHDGALYLGTDVAFGGGVKRWDGNTWSAVGELMTDGFSSIQFAVFENRLVASRGSVWALDGEAWAPLPVSGDWEGSVAGSLAVHDGQLIASYGNLRRFDPLSGSWTASRGPALWDGSTWRPLDLSLSAFAERGLDPLASCGDALCFAGIRSPTSSTPHSSIQSPVTWRQGEITTMGPGSGSGATSLVSAVLLHGNDLYVGGQFSTIGGVSANGVARWDGRRWWPLGELRGGGMRGFVTSLAMYQGQLYASGAFYDASMEYPTTFAVMRWDGVSWHVVGEPPLSAGISIRAMVEWRGELYIGGNLSTSAVAPFSDETLLRWNGTAWQTLPNAGRAWGRVNALAVKDDELYVGGILGGYAGGSESPLQGRVLRWDGSAWHRLESATGADVDQEVYSLLVDGSDLYVGGAFGAANVGNPIQTPGLARWDGTTWHAVGSNRPAMLGIRSISKSGDSLYVGAGRAVAGPNFDLPLLAKWDGNEWTTEGLAIAGRIVNAIADYPGVSGILIGGEFGATGGVASSNVAMFGRDPRVFDNGFESLPPN